MAESVSSHSEKQTGEDKNVAVAEVCWSYERWKNKEWAHVTQN